jgi:hypothetical protein
MSQSRPILPKTDPKLEAFLHSALIHEHPLDLFDSLVIMIVQKFEKPI